MCTSTLNQIQKLFETPQKVVIIPHQNPDGDALGSCLALSQFLNNKNHNASVISPNEYPDFLKWLPGEDDILLFNNTKKETEDKISNADVIFTLDFNSLSRAENITKFFEKRKGKIVMIDHHQAPEAYADVMYSDSSMSSTCEMVFNVLEAWDTNAINPAIATCLYTGIMTDTGSFRFPSTTASTHRTIAQLLEFGANGTAIHENIFDTSSLNRIKLLGRTICNLKKVEGLPVVYMTLNQAELNKHNYKKGDTEGFVNYGLSLLGIQLSVIMIENQNEGKIKMSFRSKGTFSVNTFARKHFNGGGHINAAGGMSMLSMEETVLKFMTHINTYSNQFESND